MDGEVVQRARRGDAEAFGLIVEEYRDRLFGLALGMVRNRDAAEDIVQEAFIKAYKNISGFRGESSIYTWLYRIAVNTAHNHLRRTRRLSPVDFDDVAPILEARGLNPAQKAANAELGEAIEKAVHNLPPRQREVFLLHYFEQMTHREIAETLGITEGAVKANFFHAVQKLKGALKTYVT
ncbi:MAG: sigma-70 family RNA polymerase sigma factor [Candidatus Coatesbacteria bacterium]|nr:MAG: sigma-70 family RNA polymerase sigma factor [Candidatus Coatesbacteria bacterium]